MKLWEEEFGLKKKNPFTENDAIITVNYYAYLREQEKSNYTSS